MHVPQLTPGPPGLMLQEAIAHLKTLPRDPAVRADAFEAMARQIEHQSASSWNAARGPGSDASIIFLGRQGEALVVAVDGKIYRGALGRGIDITSGGLTPDFGTLKPLD